MSRDAFLADEAISDVVGTVMTLAITLALIGVCAAQFGFLNDDAAPAPQVDFRVRAEPGSSIVSIVQAGGDAVERSDVRVMAIVNGVTVHDADLGASGTRWNVGERVQVSLPAALVEGDLLEIVLVSETAGTTLGSAQHAIPADDQAAGAAPVGFDVVVEFEGGGTSAEVEFPASVLIIATTDHPDGRRAIAFVTVDASDVGGSARHMLRDDGMEGDEVAGDGIFAGYLLVLKGAGVNTLEVTAEDVDGATTDADLTLTVTDPDDARDPRTIVRFDDGFVSDAGVAVLKYDGGAPGDKVTMHLKIDLVNNPMTISGSTYTLSAVEWDWAAFKPGSDPPIPMSRFCQDATQKVQVWYADNATIEKLEREFDTLTIFFTLTWTKATGTGPASVTTVVDSTDYAELLVVPKGTYAAELRYDTWPRSFGDCNDV